MNTDAKLCADLLPKVSRTFAISIQNLPDELREPIQTAYLLCRIVDTIEDTPNLPLTEREAMFNGFDALIGDATSDASSFEALFRSFPSEHSPDMALCQHAGSVVRCFRDLDPDIQSTMREPIRTMSLGMRAYARRAHHEGRLRIYTMADLERYCYYVAGTVGELLTALFLKVFPQEPQVVTALESTQVEFGIGLQLVNIVKDVPTDLERDTCYLPEDLLGEAGLTSQTILKNRDVALPVLRKVTTAARAHLKQAAHYIESWPESAHVVRTFTLLPLALALGTLTLIDNGGEDVLVAQKTPKVHRNFVGEILQRANEAAGNNASLRKLLAFASTPEALHT